MGDLQTDTFISHYKILEKLGEGGMGTVYLALDTQLHRQVALKFLSPYLLRSREHKTRFVHEARAAAALNHPNVATVYEIDEVDGEVFIAMEYIDGETLSELTRRGPLPIKDVLNIALQAALGLQAAHDSGIVHRDIKSGNIMLTAGGQVKITDFGLAKLPVRTKLTMDGTTVGTISYISPEQALGEEVDQRADLWSLGVVIYEMVCGCLPFRGDYEQAIIYGILNLDPRPPTAIRTGVPMDLERLIFKLLMKDRAARYQDADDLIVDINAVDLTTLLASRFTLPPEEAEQSIASRFPYRFWSGIALGLVLGAVALFAWRRPALPLPAPTHADIEEVSLPLHSTQSLRLAGSSNDLAFSPDGRRLAYVADRESEYRLFVRTVGRINAVSEIPGSENAEHPFFSRDGKVLGFHVAGTFMRVRMDDLGATPEVVSDSAAIPWGATWMNDSTIVFGNGTLGLYRVSMGHHELEAIVAPDAEKGELGYYWPEMLPGGREVVFTIWRGEDLNQASLALLSLDTGAVRDLDLQGANARYAPTGHLVYGRWDNNNDGRIMAVPFDRVRGEVTGTPRIIHTGIDIRQQGAASFSFSDTGRLAYFSSQANSRSLVWVNRTGDREALELPKKDYSNPTFSPDGRAVAMDIYSDIYIYDLGRGSLLPFTEGGVNFEPVWHPLDDLLVFSSNRSGQTHLYAKPLNGTGEAELLVQGNRDHQVYASSWSPDGDILAYYIRKNAADRDIYVWSRQEGRSIPIAVTEANERTPMFSPDGRWIAYMSDASGREEIWVRPYPARGNEAHQVSQGGGTEPIWWPEAPFRGQLLSYRRDNQLLLVEVETTPRFRLGTPDVLFEGQYYSTLYRSEYDMHPYEDRFLMIAVEQSYNQINVDLDWFATLRARLAGER